MDRGRVATGDDGRLDERRLAVATAMVDGWVASRLLPGVSLAVALDGEVVLTHAAGRLSAGGGAPVTPETRYAVASLTKPVTAATVMALVERGDLYLDEPVRRWLPEFATPTGEAARRVITARELLCHVAGLPKDDAELSARFAREESFAAIAGAAAEVPLVGPPGERVRYSNAGYWVLGSLIAVATRSPYAEVATALVLGPAGLAGSALTLDAASAEPGEPGDALPVARRYGPDRSSNTPYGRRLGSPSGGLFATAPDLARFAGAFAAGGQGHAGGRGAAAGRGPVTGRGPATGISAASVRLMTTDQTAGAAMPLPAPVAPREPPPPLPAGPLPGGIPGLREWASCPWAFGWEVRGGKDDHWTGELVSPRTICHIGQSGCLAWADPDTGLSVAVLANRDLGSGWATGGRPENSPGAVDAPPRWALLSNVIVSSLRP